MAKYPPPPPPPVCEGKLLLVNCCLAGYGFQCVLCTVNLIQTPVFWPLKITGLYKSTPEMINPKVAPFIHRTPHLLIFPSGCWDFSEQVMMLHMLSALLYQQVHLRLES